MVFNWQFAIIWGVVVGAYLLGLLIFTLVKRYKNKKNFEKEVKDNEDKNENR